MVVRLAESLGVSLRERNALLLAAGYAPAYDQTAWDAPGLAPIRAALEAILEGHRPYPAVLVDRLGDAVAANQPFWRLTAGAAPGLLQAPVNVPRLLLDPRGLAPQIENLEVWAWHVIDALRTQRTHEPSERLELLVAELIAMVPPRPVDAPDHLGFAVPLRLRRPDGKLRLLTTLTHFGTAVDVTIAELRIEAFLPADASTADALRQADGTA